MLYTASAYGNSLQADNIGSVQLRPHIHTHSVVSTAPLYTGITALLLVHALRQGLRQGT